MATAQLLSAIAAYIPRDRVEQLLYPARAVAADGVALIADVSGFTPLTEALAAGLSADQGAEELTRALASVFTPLVRAIHAYGGSVLKFSGDALIVWYPRPARGARALCIRRAVASALLMQREMAAHGTIATPIGPVVLRMKIGLVFGPLRRFALGLAAAGLEDAPVGATLDRMAEAEHHAEPGEILIDQETLALAPGAIDTGEERDQHRVIRGLRRPPTEHPWPPLDWGRAATDDLLERLTPYVPAPIARTLASGRMQVAELRPVVSMFVQFHGLDYDRDPLVGERLQRYFAAAQQVADRYGGRVNRLITGDKGSLLHVIFGAPIAVEEQEARALRCALDLQRECGQMPFISMQRIGVAGGRVFAGPVGAPDRHDYTTMGDAINLSARLMQNAADGQILVEAGVAALAGGELVLRDLGAIRVKGKAEPIAVCAVEGVRAARRSVASAPAIYGRDQERALIAGQIGQLEQGVGGLVVLAGELGMGKTLLIETVRRARAGGLRWLQGTCLAYGQQLSGYSLIDALRDLLELPEGATAEETRDRLQALCADLFGAEQVAATFPYLARFMGLPIGEQTRRLEGLSGESLRWRIFELVPDLLQRAAQRSPLVVAIDDIQWSDPTSLELIEQIAPLTREAPILLILAMRPDQAAPSWQLSHSLIQRMPERSQMLTLAPFDAPRAAGLVRQIAPGIPESFALQLAAYGGGNPLFLVELVRAIVARGLLSDPAQLEQTPIASLGLPDSVQGLLVAQIDRLAVDARYVLQVASVIGPSFLERVLATIAAGERALDARLLELTGEQYIQPEDTSGEAYRFRHALIQQSAYGTLLYERRRAYHREVAEALEALFPSQMIEQAGLLAYHYERAELYEQAITYQLQAADSARLLAANQEAEGLYRRALALIEQQVAGGAPDDPGRRARIMLKLAQVRANELDFSGAQELYDQAFTLLELEEARRPAQTSADGAPREIRIGVFEHGPASLDPGLITTSGDEEIIKDLFEGLVELDPDLNIIPACARRWQVSDDGLRYRFELRPGLRWSDGAALTAHDFVFAWRRNLDPLTNSSLASLLFSVDGAETFHSGSSLDPGTVGIQALDAQTLEVRLAHPSAAFMYILTDPITFPQPAHIVAQLGSHAFTPAQLVGNGTFRIEEWAGEQPLRLRRNSFYHGLTQGDVELVQLRYIAPSLEHYRGGQIDLCRIDDQVAAATPGQTQIILLQYRVTYFVIFACEGSFFRHKEARQAFAMCIDRQHLVDTVWAGVQKPATGGVIPAGMTGHSPEIGVIYQPARARELLAHARDQIDGAKTTLRMAAIPGMATVPSYLAEQWRTQLHIAFDMHENVPFDETLAGLSDGTFDLAVLGCEAETPDPYTILSGFTQGELFSVGWGSQPFDQLVRALGESVNPQQRAEYAHEAERLIASESPILPLYYRQAYAVLRERYELTSSSAVIRGGSIRLKYIRHASRE